MRRAARTDTNQDEIVRALRMAGCSVAITSQLGNGFPDLLVARNGLLWLMEIKDGSRPLSQQRLTPAEADFHATWKGKVCIVRSVDEALKIIA